MMAYSEDDIALAAEYALGTLDADERAQVETMMAADTEFTADRPCLGIPARRPQPDGRLGGAAADRLGEHPRAVGHSGPQAPLVLPETPQPPPPAAPAEAEAAPAPTFRAPRVQTSSSCRAGCGAGAMWRRSQPLSLLRWSRCWRCRSISRICCRTGIRPKPRTQVVEVKTPAPPAPPSAQYVALLQRDGGAPAFILTVDAATKNFTVRKVGADAEPGKSFELWLISDKLPQPRSLGVIGVSEFTARPVLSSYDANTINTATYAVTVEQAGGSPDGKPHSTPIYTGKLIETVPAAAPPR